MGKSVAWTIALAATATLSGPLPLLAAGGGGGYISDAPIPWHLTHDTDGRKVIVLIEQAEKRLGLEIGLVTVRLPPAPVDQVQSAPTQSDGTLQLAVAEVGKPETVAPVPLLAIPYQSLIYWSDGTTWVYGEVGARQYTRMPVEVAHIEGDQVLLAKGPAEGTRVVTFGAAELFGAETGTGH